MKERETYVDIMQYPAEVTGSLILGVVKHHNDTTKFLLDCGMYQEREYEDYNKIFLTTPNDVKFVLLSHNHVDHIGRLPYLVKKGFEGTVYTSKATSMIIGKALYDSAKVVRDTSKRKNETAIYDSDDVDKTMEHIQGCDYNVPINVAPNITVTFVPNGHLVGAASILVQINCPKKQKDINIFFTGDYNSTNLFFKVPSLKKWIKDLPMTIITESTYGYMDSSEINCVFERNIFKALREKKTIIIPVFSLGRAQEILYYLKNMQSKKWDLFEDIPIYYDGKLSIYYTDLYTTLIEKGILNVYEDKRDFLPLNLKFVENKVIRREVISNYDCKIIVTTSGMGSYGPANTYIQNFIGYSKALIHFTGYCSEGTLGYNLKYTEKGEIVEVGGVKAIKQADVEFTNEFSAHAKADELLDFLKKFRNPRFVLVTHGTDASKDMFSNRILKEIKVKHVGILGREYSYRINQDGFVQSYTSKFL